MDSQTYTLEYKYELDRDFQDIFTSILNKINIDGYGSFQGNIDNVKEEYRKTFEVGGYENDIFYIRPYNWEGMLCADCNCGLDDKLCELELDINTYGFHSKNCNVWEINFYYKPTNLKIAWYKYALRSAYSNQNLKKDMIELILWNCVNSVILKD